jgi:NAD(P)-dependent dehydrogenase (short-subunit alcohol dehydrogenase family)
MGRLDGKVAIVTGAGGGIGKEHALLLAREGARVVVNDTGLRTGADATSVVAAIEAAGGTAIGDTHSATSDGADDVVGAALDAFGRVDILINNATAGRINDLWRFTDEEWDLTIAVNLTGYFAMTRSVAPDMCRRGSGVIVNTSSGSGFGHPSMVAYSTAKEGVVGLTRTTARELGRFGVRCNAIRPLGLGVSSQEYDVDTAAWGMVMGLTMGPVPGQLGEPPDPDLYTQPKIAQFVVWLCTSAAANVNGRTFDVGGDDVSLLSEPERARTVHQRGGWDLDALDAVAPRSLTVGLTNGYTLDDHPDLKEFPD